MNILDKIRERLGRWIAGPPVKPRKQSVYEVMLAERDAIRQHSQRSYVPPGDRLSRPQPPDPRLAELRRIMTGSWR